jgi:hypothetical protein
VYDPREQPSPQSLPKWNTGGKLFYHVYGSTLGVDISNVRRVSGRLLCKSIEEPLWSLSTAKEVYSIVFPPKQKSLVVIQYMNSNNVLVEEVFRFSFRHSQPTVIPDPSFSRSLYVEGLELHDILDIFTLGSKLVRNLLESLCLKWWHLK